jgi:hypothetical protein
MSKDLSDCGQPPALAPYADSSGPLTMCAPAPNPGGGGPGQLYDVSRYTDFFARPAAQGGVKTDPADVILAAIAPPAEPVQVILANPGTPGGQSYQPCSPLNEQSNPPCVPVIQVSCHNQQNPVFFGDPTVRLKAVVQAAGGLAASICDADYSAVLAQLASRIAARLNQ